MRRILATLQALPKPTSNPAVVLMLYSPSEMYSIIQRTLSKAVGSQHALLPRAFCKLHRTHSSLAVILVLLFLGEFQSIILQVFRRAVDLQHMAAWCSPAGSPRADQSSFGDPHASQHGVSNYHQVRTNMWQNAIGSCCAADSSFGQGTADNPLPPKVTASAMGLESAISENPT